MFLLDGTGMIPEEISKSTDKMFSAAWRGHTQTMAAFMAWGVSEKWGCGKVAMLEILELNQNS